MYVSGPVSKGAEECKGQRKEALRPRYVHNDVKCDAYGVLAQMEKRVLAMSNLSWLRAFFSRD